MPVPEDSERLLIASALIDSDIVDESDAYLVAASDFGSAARSEVWGAISELRADGAPVSVPLVVERLRSTGKLAKAGGEAGIFELESEFPDVGAASYYAERVMNGARLRKAAKYLRQLLGAQWAEFDEVRGRISSIAAELEGEGSSSLDAHISTALDGAEDIYGSPLQTGLRLWDEFVPLYPGRFVIVAAPSGHGKSALTGDLIIRAAIKDQPAMISLYEMGRREFAVRALAAGSGVPQGKIIAKDPAEAQFVEPVREGLRRSPIWVFDESSETVEGFAAKCRRLKRESGLRIAAADYVQIMAESPGVARQSREQSLAHIGRSLKRLARELEITVIGVSQLNEDGKTRESRSLTNDADAVVRMNNRAKDDRWAGSKDRLRPWSTIEIDLPKVRYAAGRQIQMRFEGATMRFRDK